MNAAGREEQRAVQFTGDDAAAGDVRLNGHTTPVANVMHELGRRQLLLVGPDRPGIVVKIERRIGGCQVDIGFPVGIQRPGIAPVIFLFLGFFRCMDATAGEGMGAGDAVPDRLRNDVLAEVMTGGGVGDVADEFGVKVLGVENVDAHAAQRNIRLARHGRRIGRLFNELGNFPVVVDAHDTEAGGFLLRYFDAGHRAFRAAVHVIGQHGGVVHLVDVVTRQDDDVFGFGVVGLQDVNVLINGVGGAAIPGFFVDALLGRHEIDKLIDFAAQEAPAALQVAQQAVRLVLRDDADAADARIHAVGQREVNDAELATKINRRFGPPVSEFMQAATAPTRQHQCDCPSGQLERATIIHFLTPR